MRAAFRAVVIVGCVLSAAAVLAQEKSRPLPLSTFVATFTNPSATSAQKEIGLPEGTWYEGTITVTDVEHYKQQGSGEAFAEIKDVNYEGGCYLLLFRVQDTAKALSLKVGDKVVIRGRLSNMGMSTTKYVLVCETRFALFKDCEILEVVKAEK
jgi:hypothetical protein